MSRPAAADTALASVGFACLFKCNKRALFSISTGAVQPSPAVEKVKVPGPCRPVAADTTEASVGVHGFDHRMH